MTRHSSLDSLLVGGRFLSVVTVRSECATLTVKLTKGQYFKIRSDFTTAPVGRMSQKPRNGGDAHREMGGTDWGGVDVGTSVTR